MDTLLKRLVYLILAKNWKADSSLFNQYNEGHSLKSVYASSIIVCGVDVAH
jgi:hypothetical protein